MPNREHFALRLAAAIRAKATPLCVGLDPQLEMLPLQLVQRWRRLRGNGPWAAALAYEEFCRRVLDVVAPLVAVVKVQSAFFEQLGPPGIEVMFRIIAKARAAGLFIIFDGKRNDIGSTAQAYAAAYLGTAPRPCATPTNRQRQPAQPADPADAQSDPRIHQDPASTSPLADAVTVNPYLGLDSLEPFVTTANQTGTGLFVLVKTSNPGSADFQDLHCDGIPLYRHIAERVEQLARQSVPSPGVSEAPNSVVSPYGSIGAVVGATHPDQVAELRNVMPHTWLLLPGYGAQGAGAAELAGAFDANGSGAIVNSSRAILFAHLRQPYAVQFGQDQWEAAVERATRDAIEEFSSILNR